MHVPEPPATPVRVISSVVVLDFVFCVLSSLSSFLDLRKFAVFYQVFSSCSRVQCFLQVFPFLFSLVVFVFSLVFFVLCSCFLCFPFVFCVSLVFCVLSSLFSFVDLRKFVVFSQVFLHPAPPHDAPSWRSGSTLPSFSWKRQRSPLLSLSVRSTRQTNGSHFVLTILFRFWDTWRKHFGFCSGLEVFFFLLGVR